jgi:TonB-linked SusC/RagA family outer membrane protein
MKNCLHVFARCLLLTTVILGGFQLASFAQVYATASPLPLQRSATNAPSLQSESKRSVRTILFALEESYHVSFSYNDALVRDLTLKENFTWDKNETLEAVLRRLVDEANLKFEKVSSDSYLILSEKKQAEEKKGVDRAIATPPENTDPFAIASVVPMKDKSKEKDAHAVSGTVKDDTNNPLPGVNVVVKGTTNGTTTDSDGKFALEVPNGDEVLIFSFIGYATQEVAISNRTSIDVSLASDLNTLDEVVVVGYGEQKRVNLLGSVAEVKPEEVQDFPVANLGTALVNRVPGVSVSTASGKPGANTTISIRNPVTFGNMPTSPLYVIDGVMVPQEYFDNLDATQVESITFLKDAAASIYGSQGSNGVVLVRTKRGAPGKAKISYQGSYAISKATKFPKMMSGYQYATALNDFYASEPALPTPVPSTSFYTPDELEYLKTHNYSWLDETWQDSHLQRHTLNVSGGSDNVTYFAGGSFYDETGNLRDLYVKKYSLRFGINAKITDNLTADISMSLDNAVENRPAPKGFADQSETMDGTIASLTQMPGWVPMYIGDKPVYASTIKWHPYELQNSGSYSRSKSQGVMLNASLEYKIQKIKGLSVRVQFAKEGRTVFGKEYYASYNTYEFVQEGDHTNSGTYGNPNVIYTDQVNKVQRIKNGDFLNESHNSLGSYQLNEAITYKRTFGLHDFNLLLLAEQGESSGDNFQATREGQVIPEIDQFFGFSANKNNWDNTGSGTETGRMSYLGRLNYIYMDRYLLEATFRADASPNFPTHSHWGYFPSVAVGWKISEENFFRDNVSFVNDLKIRFQVGLTGNNNVRPYGYKERYTQTTGMVFGNILTNGLNNNDIPNPNITWEKALYKNLGIDGTFFNRKFNFAIDLYHRYNYDMFDIPSSTVPTTLGANINSQNYARLKSWGIEGALTYNGSVQDFKYSIGVNTGYTDNRIERKFVGASDKGTWRDPNGRRTDTGIEGYKTLGIVRTQEELDAFLVANPGYKIDGVDPEVGWMLFEDQNSIDTDGDGKWDAKDGVINGDDKVRLKERSGSRFGMGYNLGASWKGFKFSVNIALALGGYDVYDKPARTIPDLKGAKTGLTHWTDAWSVNNPDAKYPKLEAKYISEVYDLWIVSATTMRVNNMSLSYTLPSRIQEKLRLPEVRILFTGTNLWDIINNQPYKYSTANLSVDYPALRTYTMGINLTL